MEECEHGSDPTTCQVCKPRLRTPPEMLEYTFIAKFTTECAKCDGAIFDGQVAVRMTTGRIFCDVCSGSTNELDFR